MKPQQYDTDILIIGGGLAGLQGALSASEKYPDLKITIADIGGCASTEIMGFCAPVLPEDSPELFLSDCLNAANGLSNIKLLKILTGNALNVVHALERLGVSFDREKNGQYALVKSIGSSVSRVLHHNTTTGRVIMEKYREILFQNPKVTFEKIQILKLFTHKNRVIGALGSKRGKTLKLYKTKSIILATGGAAGLFDFSTWSKALRGSGCALALEAGVRLLDMDIVQFEPCVTVSPEELKGYPVITTLLFEGARLLDKKGLPLFEDNNAPSSKKELAEMINDSMKKNEEIGVIFDFSGIKENDFSEKYPEYHNKLMGVFGSFKNIRLEVKPAAHTTLGGVVIDEHCSTTIKGFFAAGEVVGGIHGADRIGGNAGLETLVFGSLAGSSAAEFTNSNREKFEIMDIYQKFIKNKISEKGTNNAKTILSEIGQIMDIYCGAGQKSSSRKNGLLRLQEKWGNFKRDPIANLEKQIVCEQAFIIAESILNNTK